MSGTVAGVAVGLALVVFPTELCGQVQVEISLATFQPEHYRYSRAERPTVRPPERLSLTA